MKTALQMIVAFFIGVATVMLVQRQNMPPLVVFNTQENIQLGLPFSEATRVGNTLYVSGQIGVELGTLRLVEGGVKGQTTQTLRNIETVLKRYGSSLDKVAKCTVFLAHMSQWRLMNEAYVEVFGDHRPARSALGASDLALGAEVEIECIAVVE